MNRRGRDPLWARVIALAAALVVAALLAFLVTRGLMGALGLRRSRGAGARDPQFAEPAETVTRPPELDESGSPVGDEDPSAHWEQGEQTPVDKTAEELIREVEAGS